MEKFGEIDFADTRAGKFFASVDGGLSGVSRVRGHGSEDPHRRYRKLILLLFLVLVPLLKTL